MDRRELISNWYKSLTKKQKNIFFRAVVWIMLCGGIYLILMGWWGQPLMMKSKVKSTFSDTATIDLDVPHTRMHINPDGSRVMEQWGYGSTTIDIDDSGTRISKDGR